MLAANKLVQLGCRLYLRASKVDGCGVANREAHRIFDNRLIPILHFEYGQSSARDCAKICTRAEQSTQRIPKVCRRPIRTAGCNAYRMDNNEDTECGMKLKSYGDTSDP